MKKLLVILLASILLTACATATPQVIVVTATPIPATSTIELTVTITPTRTVPPTSTALPPRLQDFDLALIVVEKQCFGSAGCLITIRPELAFPGIRYPYDRVELEPGKTYTLIYEVYGGEDGTLTFNLTIKDGQYTFDEHLVSTAHKDDELTVKAVRLIEN